MSRTTMMWQKSSYCSDGACVEVAFDGDVVAVRDGKNPGQGDLRFAASEWDAFVHGIKANEFRPF